MHIATSLDLPISENIMHKYVVGLTTLNITMHMLSDKLDKGARAVYPDAMEVKVRF